MKTSKIIRVICWSLLALFLISMLTYAIAYRTGGARHFSFPGFNIHFGDFSGFDDAFDDVFDEDDSGSGRYSASGTYSVPAAGIKNVEIEWISGKVEISAGSGDSIEFTEFCSQTLENEEKLVYSVKGDTLLIRVWRQRTGIQIGSFGHSKDLVVTIPSSLASDMGSLDVSAVSADVRVDGITTEDADFETISGRISLGGMTADSVETSSTSGDIELNGTFGDIQSNSVSGKIEIRDTDCPDRVEISTVSGNATLVIPENDGFSVKFDKVSGDFVCEFPITTSHNGGTYKDGGARFNMSTVSGDLKIRSAEND